MKLEDLAFAIVQKVFEKLLHRHHFHIPEAVQEAVRKEVLAELNKLVA